jgi:TetR/AcrR family transcriptional regulator, regulator of cefoperazone and chloramphenicol sensitivity
MGLLALRICPVRFLAVSQLSPAGRRASRGEGPRGGGPHGGDPRGGPASPAGGRLRLLDAGERVLATRGLEVPDRVIVTEAGQHNRSAVSYHFGSRAGLIEAIRERHETPIAQHRHHLISRLPGPGDRTTRELAEAYLRPLTAEMLRCAPSHWARFTAILLLDRPLRFTRDLECPGPGPDGAPARPALCDLFDLIVAHLARLPEPEAAGRVALTIRFLIDRLAGWERDSQADPDLVAPLTAFSLILTDLAVAMLDAPGSVPPRIDAEAGYRDAARLGAGR